MEDGKIVKHYIIDKAHNDVIEVKSDAWKLIEILDHQPNDIKNTEKVSYSLQRDVEDGGIVIYLDSNEIGFVFDDNGVFQYIFNWKE